MIDFTDDINITAAGYATQIGNAEILRYLLENNAKMKSDRKTARLNILDCAYGYFKTGENSLKEIIRFCTRNGKIQILQEVYIKRSCALTSLRYLYFQNDCQLYSIFLCTQNELS